MLTTIDRNPLSLRGSLQRPLLTSAATLIVFAAGLGLCNGSEASVLDIRFDQELRYSMKEKLEAGKSIELCGLLAKQSQVAWDTESDVKLDFNIHFHVAEKVHYPTKLKQIKKASAQLDVAQEQTYCWMWTNRSTKTAIVNANLEKLK